jgi:hypothetical protein
MKTTIFTLAFAALAALSTPAFAQLPAVQTFSGFNIGDVAGQGSWNITGTTATPNAQIVAGDVNISGLTTLTDDRALQIVGGGQDVGISFGSTVPATDGTFLYASAVISVTATVGAVEADVPPTDPANNNADDDYFMHFTEGTAAGGTGFRGRVFIDNSATGFRLGVRNTSGDPAVYYSTELPFNTPTLVVLKLSFNASNDTAAIFVNRVVSTEPGSPDAIDTVNAVEFAAIGRFGVRADSVLETPQIKIDQIRFGQTWAEVVPVAAPPAASASDWNLYSY